MNAIPELVGIQFVVSLVF
uniref:Uncharacterized protein n=1 Tax=Arundo donax TaxID=35708 RepID=A0A0A8Z568_ARUDO